VLERDEALRPVRIRRSDGHAMHTIALRNNWRGQAEEVRIEAVLMKNGAPDPATRLERVWHYRYDGQGRLLAATQPGGLPARFEYDQAGRLVSRVMPDGSRVVTVQDSEGRTSAEARFADGDLAPARALGAVGYAYDQAGRLESLSDIAGRRGRSEYTSQGQVAELSNALGAATRFEYDENGMLTVRTNAANTPDAASVRLAYDAHGSAVKITDANGVATERRYDDFGRKVMEANTDRGVTLFMYDQAGHVLARIDDSLSATRYRYDHAGRLVALGRDQQTDLVRYRYEGWRLAETTSASGGKEQRTLERTSYVYDAFGQILREQRWLANPEDKAGQGLNFVTGSKYDEAGRLLAQTLPDGHQLGYRYAAGGQLREVLFDGKAVVGEIEQTLAGGLRAYTMANGVRQQFSVDAHGRVAGLSAVTQGAAAPQGWLARAASWFGSPSAAGPRTVYRQVNHYDEAQRLVGIERERAGLAGQPSAARKERYGYDALDRLTRVEQGDGAVTRFAYDPGGNRTSQTTSLDAPRVIRTALAAPHDAQETGTRQYIYQAGSNRLVGQTDAAVAGATQQGVSAWLYHATGVPMVQFAGGSSPLRPAADLLREPRRRIEYNSARRPVAVYGAQQQALVRYYYNSQGERIAKTVFTAGAGGVRTPQTTYSLYRGQRLAAEADAQGRITAHYVYLNGKPVAKIELAPNDGVLHRAWRVMATLNGLIGPAGPDPSDSEASIYAIHGDHLGTPQAVTDSAQRVVWQASTTPFGQARVLHAAGGAKGRPFEMNLRLPGQVYDAETGLNHNYYRDYDPQLGRYTTPDPMGIEGGMNPYLYVGANPLSNVDPLGLYQSDIHYYMNFFLAIAAGVSVEEAQVLALAAQYVDDNPDTKPLNLDTGVSDAHRARLLSYHFTMVPSKIDVATGLVKGGVSDYGSPPGSAAYANIPENEQLKHLYAAVTAVGQASNLENTRCSQLQFMGEYLHSFEDTFAHRDSNNNPFPLNVGLGHGGYGSNPDYTYNHWSAIPLPGAMNWNHNEERTLQMEKEVLAKLAAFRAQEGTAHSFSDIEALLKKFNAIAENEGDGYDPEHPKTSEKIKLLQGQLTAWGIEGVDWLSDNSETIYDSGKGKDNRNRFLCDQDGKPLDQVKYAGTILPTKCQ
jgi:RHS repeat-associated protein